MNSLSGPSLPDVPNSIRIKQSDRGTIVSYPLRLNQSIWDFLGVMLFAGVIIAMGAFFLTNFNDQFNVSLAERLVISLFTGLVLAPIFLWRDVIDFFIGRADFTVEEGELVCQHRPLSKSEEGGRIKMADLERVVVEQDYTSKAIRHALRAHPMKGKGYAKKLIGHINPNSGRALCVVLHEQLGVPVDSGNVNDRTT
ncbi:protein of unknown function [Candidatus Promineifilum breve]|uniref:Uncharacterized protein n=1 Tax=Candidatus Promineifilum breve TaxID=1806508 RepID=A0A161JZI3_9CHLR|nr:hypothetical protein [Candidatus Promineifilum breve]CUS06317.1 protein of unknown function [Candidatus Promineifilum breve]